MKSVKRGAEQAGSAAWTWVTQWQRSRRALVAANEAVAHRARAGRPLHLYCSALLHRATRQTFVGPGVVLLRDRIHPSPSVKGALVRIGYAFVLTAPVVAVSRLAGEYHQPSLCWYSIPHLHPSSDFFFSFP